MLSEKLRTLKGVFVMHDYCIKDPYDQCFHDCDGCPQCNREEPDPDELYERYRDMMNEREC